MTKIEELYQKYGAICTRSIKKKPAAVFILVDEARKRYYIARSRFSGRNLRTMSARNLPMIAVQFLRDNGLTPAHRCCSIILTQSVPDAELRELFKGWTPFKSNNSALSISFREAHDLQSEIWKIQHTASGITYYISKLEEAPLVGEEKRRITAVKMQIRSRLKQLSEYQELFSPYLASCDFSGWTSELHCMVPGIKAKIFTRRLNDEAMSINIQTLLSSR